MKNFTESRKSSWGTMALGLALLTGGATGALAQNGTMGNEPQNTATQQTAATMRSVANGQKMTIKGVLVKREDDQSFVVRDDSGADTMVVLDNNTSVKTKGGFFGGGKKLGSANLLRGLSLEVEGRGDTQGRLVASKVRFAESEYRVARSIEARVDPVEGRLSGTETRISQVEDSARRTSGQLDELVAVSNAARGGARAAQETADTAVQGVRATNERIGDIDNYEPQDMTAINFRTGSAVLSADAKAQLDAVATKAMAARGYLIEVTGYTDAAGNVERNRALSKRRAEAVIQYLLDNHQIPLRRVVPSYGYGENNAVADNTTREGRAQNRRVEVKLLVSRGLTQPAPAMATPQPEQPQQ